MHHAPLISAHPRPGWLAGVDRTATARRRIGLLLYGVIANVLATVAERYVLGDADATDLSGSRIPTVAEHWNNRDPITRMSGRRPRARSQFRRAALAHRGFVGMTTAGSGVRRPGHLRVRHRRCRARALDVSRGGLECGDATVEVGGEIEEGGAAVAGVRGCVHRGEGVYVELGEASACRAA